ncbi:hypothetical protein, partial [Shewanella xiamenensis]|uniref:hypothetical protein n=1 Tax=Shewanella xiamenensis TaxID=332186 RepID=UPI0024A6D4FE
FVVVFSVYSFANTLFFEKTSAVPDSVLQTPETASPNEPKSKVSLLPKSSSLLDDAETQLLTKFVSDATKDVYISGSQYVKKSNGLVHFHYSFFNPVTDE